MSLADLLTALRLLLAPAAGLAIVAQLWAMAAALIAAAIVSDLLDGIVARRFNRSSAHGRLFDHGTDCVFVTCTLFGLAAVGKLNWLLPTLVPLAFLQYVLDSRVLAGETLRTNALGRANGVAFFALAAIAVAAEIKPFTLLQPVPGPLAWLLAATTLASMSERLFHVLRLRLPGREP